MRIPFTKMHGAGNDFVMIDNRSGAFALTPGQIAALCHRRFGIGADGLLLLQQPDDPAAADARMVYFNADGSRADMCGNGARCFTAFAISHGVGTPERLRFVTDAGPMTALVRDGQITIAMTPPRDFRLRETLALKPGPAEVHHVNTGVPHAVKFVPDVAVVDIRPEGAELRFHPAWGPKGANANFAQIRTGAPVLVRTYERGVEDETLACGTGVTAVGILAHLVHGVPLPVRVQVAGGDVLTVDFQKSGETLSNVTLTGPAAVVFTGETSV